MKKIIFCIAMAFCLLVGIVLTIQPVEVASAEQIISNTNSVPANTEQRGVNGNVINITFAGPTTSPIVYTGRPNMREYFSNLKLYSAQNVANSCAYVALSQYLSFYDTFYNDNLIYDNYTIGGHTYTHDRREGSKYTWDSAVAISPGIYANYNAVTEWKINKNEFEAGIRNFIETNRFDDFQVYLMYVKNTAENWSDSTPQQGGMGDYAELLENLYPDLNICYRRYYRINYGERIPDSNPTEVQAFNDIIKAEISAGNPVILGLEPSDDTHDIGHLVVAYHYDEDDIYVHFGSDATSYRKLSEEPFHAVEAFVIDFNNVPHVHSNNYEVEWVEYCGCGHRYQGHDYTYQIEDYSATKHKVYCQCGAWTTADHDFTYDCEDIDGEHTNLCLCGRGVAGEHSYTRSYVKLDSGGHSASCACGSTITEDHSYTDDHIYTGHMYHKAYCACGDYMLEGHIRIEKYINIGDAYSHNAECACEYVLTESHVFEVDVSNGEENHFVKCRCGYQKTESHSLSYQSANNLRHNVTCACGLNLVEEHELTYSYIDNTYHSCNCALCGHSHNSLHTLQVGGLNQCIGCKRIITNPGGPGQIIHSQIRMVTANGSYIVPNVCIMLVEEDIEAYFDGTLVFYDKDNPPQTA